MSEIVVRADNLSKLYRIRQREPYYTLRDAIAHAFTFRWFHNGRVSRAAENVSPPNSHSPSANGSSRPEFIWALKDIGFEVKRGEVVGIIGRNGAGKSTLLKVLSGITEPTQGCAQIRGRVGSLLEVGTGFHPELTGRENIYLNGAILGMKKAEISRKFDEIVAFAEIEKFLDTPVKHYSSGMYMRLAFSVAAHLEPEILLVDEVLAVGDAAFQKKCLGKMRNVSNDGRTVLFVSHNMAAIKALCQSAVLLDHGRAAYAGSPSEVVQNYIASTDPGEAEVLLVDEKLHRGGNDFRIERVTILDAFGTPCTRIAFGRPFQVLLEANLLRDVSGLHVGLGIASPDGTRLTTTHHSDSIQDTNFRKGRVLLRCFFDNNFYSPG
ncbi:MAG TPA: ABC transporter ATP-binding protein, partial [Candidatus Binatia bacterium]|nr:ABC transporter ATP-binding protein [Candidatus Binatia bacterium]